MKSPPLPPALMVEPPSSPLAPGDAPRTGPAPGPAAAEQPRGPGGRFGKGTGKGTGKAAKPPGKTRAKRPAPRFEADPNGPGIRRVEQSDERGVGLKEPPERAPDGKFGKGSSSGPTGAQKQRSQRRAERKDAARAEAKRAAGVEKDKATKEQGPNGKVAASMTPDPRTPMDLPSDMSAPAAMPMRVFVQAPLPVFNPQPRPAGPVTSMVAPRVLFGR